MEGITIKKTGFPDPSKFEAVTLSTRASFLEKRDSVPFSATSVPLRFLSQ